MEKPTLPKGTRDFGPSIMAKRQFILTSITSVFKKFGFLPLETPAMENLTTLTGKYGDEGDQLLFKILNSGNYYEKLIEKILSPERTTRINNFIIDSLRYLCNQLITELSDNEIRYSLDKVIQVVDKNHSHVFNNYSLYLEEIEEELLYQYYRENYVIFSIELIKFFSMANIYKEGFNEKIDFHFNQFRNNVIQEEILPSVRRYLQSELTSRISPSERTKEISEKGLRYDLTVPFARYVVMNRNEIAFPFKRYQVQPVWRADRPQKGRYREFYQCDADVVGTTSLLCEAEILLMIKEAMKNLSITNYTTKINHRGVLNGIADLIGASGKETDLFVAIDKLDKMSEEKVREELQAKGFASDKLDILFSILNKSGSNEEKLSFLTDQFNSIASGKKGVDDLKEVWALLKNLDSSDANVELDIALARGLSYYTGCIFEVKINNVSIGSVSGGGRYDNLTASFGDKENLSGVGFSFGIDRLYDAMEELNLFPKDAQVSSKILICHFDEASMQYGLKALSEFRNAGIASEIYPDQAKLKKQLDYANKKLIPFTVIIGENEMKTGVLAFKNMESGQQENLSLIQIVQKLNSSH